MSNVSYIAGLNKKNGTNRHIVIFYNRSTDKYDLYDGISMIRINGDYPSFEVAQQAASMYWFSLQYGWTCD